MTTKIYAIRSKLTGEFQTYNGRCAWTKFGNAKNAFDASRNHFDKLTFDNHYHRVYAIVELTEVYYRLEGLDK